MGHPWVIKRLRAFRSVSYMLQPPNGDIHRSFASHSELDLLPVHHTRRLTRKLQPLTITINVLSAASDVIIAAALVIALLRSKTGFKEYVCFTAEHGTCSYISRTDTVIMRLVSLLVVVGFLSLTSLKILFFVNTGLATSLCAIGSMVAVSTDSTTPLVQLTPYSLLFDLTLWSMPCSTSASDDVRLTLYYPEQLLIYLPFSLRQLLACQPQLTQES